jgi:molybdate transport system permease protein
LNTATLDAMQLTLQVASLATLIILVPGVLLAYAFARFSFRGKRIASAIVGITLVLPPTAVGYLLLQILAADGPLGFRTIGFDLNILLTWKAAVVASSVMALPLVVRTARVAFEGVDPQLEQMARTLGFGPIKTFVFFSLPLASRGLIAAAILGFTRAVGEFGATVIVAGNIPGKTQTIASAIFSAQQVGNEKEAYFLLGLAIIIGFVAIFTAETLSESKHKN